MLNNIKSLFFVKDTFRIVADGVKLDIIKYCKSLQNKLGISLINYKLFTKKYLINENNGSVKEYNILDNKLLYEGEYLNGKRNGTGKEYYYDGNIYFEGEYLNGIRWNGKAYDIKNNALYELKNGKGFVEGRYNNSYYKGEYSNGKLNGKGKEYYNTSKYKSLKFEGEYLNNMRWNGKGYDTENNILYEIKDGKGIIKELNDNNGNIQFEGEYINGKRNGIGKEYYSNGNLKFEGEYLNNMRWNGKEYDSNKNIICEIKDGKGIIKEFNDYDDKIKFEGEYINGKRNGKGKEFKFRRNLEFEGEYLNGVRHGKGKEFDYFHSFKNLNVLGKEDNNIIFEGDYSYGY